MDPDEIDRDAVRPTPAPARFWRRRPLVAGLLVGLAGALAVMAAMMVVAALQRPAALTRATFEGAVERWQRDGPKSYDLDLELSGARPGAIHVEVRGGQVTQMTRDGVEPRQKRTWDVWSVPGQFDTIEQELDMAEDPASSFGAPGAAEVVMRAEFDERYGYPRRYDRVLLGADIEVHWKITRFEVIGEEEERR